ncbi:MAG: TniB family NTP-binding protein [Sulfuritalea sp.]|nr:TniB family NTP-binding protein [Sulfuritalea sp.]
MKKVFVKTSNYERFQAAIKALEGRGAPEAGWLLVAGDPARGKSTIVDEWAAKNGAVYIRAKEQWRPTFFTDDLHDKLKTDPAGTAKQRFQRLVAKIGHERLPIVIDEVQHTLRDNAAVLEVLRDITDLTETVVVLVAGVEQVQTRIARHKQIASRIAKVVEFSANTPEDTALVCREMADIELADDLIAEIHRQSDGLMRGIVNAITFIEQHARRNRAARMTLADMAGQELIHDWQSRRPRLVKPAGGGR